MVLKPLLNQETVAGMNINVVFIYTPKPNGNEMGVLSEKSLINISLWLHLFQNLIALKSVSRRHASAFYTVYG